MRQIKNNNTLIISDLPFIDFIENDGACKKNTKLTSKIVSAV
jgi:hypothetical protein